jgi:hypothetical protein
MEQIYYQAVDMASKPLPHAEQRRVRILDTDERTYAEQDLEAFVRRLEHLTMHQQDLLLETIQTCPILFSAGLGTADVEPVDFELVPDAKCYHIKQLFSLSLFFVVVVVVVVASQAGSETHARGCPPSFKVRTALAISGTWVGPLCTVITN